MTVGRVSREQQAGNADQGFRRQDRLDGSLARAGSFSYTFVKSPGRQRTLLRGLGRCGRHSRPSEGGQGIHLPLGGRERLPSSVGKVPPSVQALRGGRVGAGAWRR